ncbi:MAG TPA: T9SS type A sorting domain-containing protein [Bacteroidetes bacterium]|nr:chlamydia polymorphic membrane protein [bacterium BMS3Bbin04]HDO64606.1 T9SS type A sorting domain-containing protein [Bacteroidota bacterium]HEX03731.1 T9SS type A sorting domain-containing protein [Bacteroidota bacterium]
MKNFYQVLMSCAMMVMAISPVFATTRNVPADYVTIQEGLDASASGDTVLVQPGIYYENIVWPVVNGIKLISAGDTSDTFIDGNQVDRVITMSSDELIDTTTLIQGFTIQNGNTDGNGGGIYCYESSPTISNCSIIGNSTDGDYGYGGGIYCFQSSPTINNCSINGNSTDGDDGYGGGIHCSHSNPTISHCTIIGNSASGYGGGIYCGFSSPTIYECTMSGNSAGTGGGIYCSQSSPTISNNTIEGNSAYHGGGISCSQSSPTISNCTIIGHSVNGELSRGGGIQCVNNSSPTITACTISENLAHEGGGILCDSDSNPEISDCTISGNSALNKGGGIRCLASSPIISNCNIIDNSAGGQYSSYGGGGIYCYASSPTISNCTISGNSADGESSGGGIYCSHSSPTISNCTISENSADDGGVVYCGLGSSPMITNSVVTNNMGEGIYVDDRGLPSNPEITYSDFYNNSDGDFGGPDVDPDLGVIVGTNANDDSCDVYYNISLDPMFVDPFVGDYHLQPGSPCIDAGDPDSPLDPDGTVADMGAFYFDQLSVNDSVESELPDRFILSAAYPNPFNSMTMVSVSLPRPAELKVSVYNVTGQQVAELAQGSFDAGSHRYTFDASGMASGMYFIRATARETRLEVSSRAINQVQKVMLVR